MKKLKGSLGNLKQEVSIILKNKIENLFYKVLFFLTNFAGFAIIYLYKFKGEIMAAKYSVVVPCFNEEATINKFYEAIIPVMDRAGVRLVYRF